MRAVLAAKKGAPVYSRQPPMVPTLPLSPLDSEPAGCTAVSTVGQSLSTPHGSCTPLEPSIEPYSAQRQAAAGVLFLHLRALCLAHLRALAQSPWLCDTDHLPRLMTWCEGSGWAWSWPLSAEYTSPVSTVLRCQHRHDADCDLPERSLQRWRLCLRQGSLCD